MTKPELKRMLKQKFKSMGYQVLDVDIPSREKQPASATLIYRNRSKPIAEQTVFQALELTWNGPDLSVKCVDGNAEMMGV